MIVRAAFATLSVLSAFVAGAEVGDFTRTVISDKLNGWDGVQFIKWTKGSGTTAGRGWAVKFDLTKGYRLRTQFGDSSGNKARVGTMAECVAEADGMVPIAGINGDYFEMSAAYARSSGIVVTDSELVSHGFGNGVEPEMCYMMETADGNLVHSEMTRHEAAPSGCPTASWQVSAGGKKIRQAIRTNYCNYPVCGGKINPVGGSSGGAVFPTTIGNMQHRTQYPRPLIGIGTNGVGVATNLVLFLNDGRQRDWSYHFPDVDAYQIMIDEGCNEVGEFDGGGSAEMWMAFGADSEYNIESDSYKTAHGNYVNRPSDGSPRADACGVFVLPPKKSNYAVEVNSGNFYSNMDDAFKAVAPGDEVTVIKTAAFAAGVVSMSCTLTAAGSATVDCAVPTVPNGVRVLFRDVAFEHNGETSTLAVAAGGTAAVAGAVGIAKISTAEADGFEVAGALTADVVVDCAAAGTAGRTFGRSSLSVADVGSSLGHVRHPTDRSQVARAVVGANGTELVWKAGVTFSDNSDGEGFSYTNRTFSVTVAAVDGDFGEGAKLRLMVRDVTGAVVATVDRAFSGTGSYSFDTADSTTSAICAGRNYTYEITIVDAEGRTFAGVDAARGAFRTAVTANWFSAAAKDDSEVCGQWNVKPEIRGGVYSIRSGTAYAFEATEAMGGIVQVTVDYDFDGGYAADKIEAICQKCELRPPQGLFALKERDDGSLVWTGLVRENGRLTCKELFGVTAEANRFYRCRQEVDYSKGVPRVSYLLSGPSGDFVRLADDMGTVWFDCPDNRGEQVAIVELVGMAKAGGIIGERSDESLLRVDGKDIVLMTSVIIDSAQLKPGNYNVMRGGHAFCWSDNGNSATYDEKTGLFVVSETVPKNGYPSYVSYLLNANPADADSRLIARFVCDETTGKTKIKLELANGEMFQPRRKDQTGVAVKVALEAANNVGFAGAQMGDKCSPEEFGPEIDMSSAPCRFFRCRVFFER